MAAKTKKHRCSRGLSIVEVMVSIVILVVVVLGNSAYRYYAAADSHRANVHITAARLASQLLNGWKGQGGYSGYSNYELLDPTDYDPTDPNDYDPTDDDEIELASGLAVYDNSAGPDVPDGFTALDTVAKPNYRIVIDGVNYYATLSYKDQVGQPRLLNVCVAWMDDYQQWIDSELYRAVKLTTYADD